MAAEKDTFLSRWSRRKHEQERERAEKPAVEREDAPPKDADEAPVLPPIENLTPQSDFSPFMHPKVQDGIRRVALKKLFSDPHFNVPDLNEAYSGDWTGGEPISQELLEKLEHARVTLFQKVEELGAQAPAPQAEPVQPQAKEEKSSQDEPGRKDA